MRGAIGAVRRTTDPQHVGLLPREMAQHVTLEHDDEIDDFFPAGAGIDRHFQHFELVQEFLMLGIDRRMSGFKVWVPLRHEEGPAGRRGRSGVTVDWIPWADLQVS